MPKRLLSILLLIAFVPLAAINIGKISFQAPEHTDISALQQAAGLEVGSVYEPAAVQAAIQNIHAYFNQQGRYFIRIPAPELIPLNAEELELRFQIRELLPSTGVRLHFSGNSYFSEDKLKQLLALGKQPTADLKDLNQMMEKVLNLYHDRGYLFASIQLDSLQLEPEPSVCLRIDEGKTFKATDYIVRGNKVTRTKTIIKLTGLSQQRVITPAALVQARENLLQKSYITDCEIQPLNPSSLLIELTESRMTYLEGLLGLSDKDGKAQLSGQFRLQFMNLWGSDRAIMLYFKQVPRLSRVLNLSYHDPGFSKVPIAADLELNRTEQDSTWTNTKAALSMYYQLPLQDIGITLQTESLNPGTRYPATVTHAQAQGASMFWNLSRLEGGMNPWKGMGFNARYGLVNTNGAQRTHTTTELGVFSCLPLQRRWVGFVNLQARNLSNPEAQPWQQYKMGGYGSLRGYHEDEFSSFRLGWINYELRYLMNTDSRVYLFFDQGFLARDRNHLKSDLFGVGGGIKVKTRLGILGIEYALGYRDKQFSRISLGMVHAGLTTNL